MSERSKESTECSSNVEGDSQNKKLNSDSLKANKDIKGDSSVPNNNVGSKETSDGEKNCLSSTKHNCVGSTDKGNRNEAETCQSSVLKDGVTMRDNLDSETELSKEKLKSKDADSAEQDVTGSTSRNGLKDHVESVAAGLCKEGDPEVHSDKTAGEDPCLKDGVKSASEPLTEESEEVLEKAGNNDSLQSSNGEKGDSSVDSATACQGGDSDKNTIDGDKEDVKGDKENVKDLDIEDDSKKTPVDKPVESEKAKDIAESDDASSKTASVQDVQGQSESCTVDKDCVKNSTGDTAIQDSVESAKTDKNVGKDSVESIKKDKSVAKDGDECVKTDKNVGKDSVESVKRDKDVEKDNVECVETDKNVGKDSVECVKTDSNAGKDTVECVKADNVGKDVQSSTTETCKKDDNQNTSAIEKTENVDSNSNSADSTKGSGSKQGDNISRTSSQSEPKDQVKSNGDAQSKENSREMLEKEGNNDSLQSSESDKVGNSPSRKETKGSDEEEYSNDSFPACLAPEVCITEEKEDSNSFGSQELLTGDVSNSGSNLSQVDDANKDDSKNRVPSSKETSPPILAKVTELSDDKEEPMDIDSAAVPKLTAVKVKEEPSDSGDGLRDDKPKDNQTNGDINSNSSDKSTGKSVADIAGKGYITETMNELLGLFGEKVDDSMKEKLQLGGKQATNNAENLDAQKKDSSSRTCAECGVNKGLKYQVVFQGKTRFLCSDTCFQVFRGKQKLAPPPAGVTGKVEDSCSVCKKQMKNGQGYFPMPGDSKAVCSEDCMKKYQLIHSPKQACAQCKSSIEGRTKCLTWETMEFCNEHCLGKYQAFLGSHCACCQSAVQRLSLGKYCVRFGSDIRQFCSGRCLEEFKKGLKVCTFCQKDLSSSQDSFLAPVGDRGQFKDFCSQQCMEQYETVNNASAAAPKNQQCSVCKKISPVKVQVKYKEKNHVLCSDPCIAAFRYANKINTCLCDTCHKFFDNDPLQLQFEGTSKRFCTKLCMNLFVLSHRKIVPCTWCKVKKYNFDMIERVDSNNHVQLFCSLNCLSLFRVSLNATSSRSMKCDHCQQMMPAQYHLTMSDASIRNFCSYKCVIQFQNQFTSVPTLTTATPSIRQSGPTPVGKATAAQSSTPIISSVMSLAPSPAAPKPAAPVPKSLTVRQPTQTSVNSSSTISKPVTTSVSGTTNSSQVVVREVLVKHPIPKVMKNKALSCKPLTQTKGVSCKPHPCHKIIQTDEEEDKVATSGLLIPIPIPIYVPVPAHMYTRHVPFPMPFPLPIPIPIFIPTTKTTTQQIVKQIKDIQEKIPENPFEAELLMMAEMVAADDDEKMDGVSEPTKKKTDSTSAKKENDIKHHSKNKEDTIPVAPLDLEDELLSSVTPPVVEPLTAIDEDSIAPRELRSKHRHSKRSAGGGRHKSRKRARVMEEHVSEDSCELATSPARDDMAQLLLAKAEKNENSTPRTSDANLCLKYMFGVNAWKHWVVQKNNELEKGSQSRKLKLFKTDLLQLSPDELNYSLCLFVKEVRKPNGEEYAPDSIYYLCLGIQLYLFENSRIDNIFTDSYYEKFTECLNEVVQKQDSIFSSEGHFVSRIEEEILWESKQLGAHSPHVLLNTLMYFNTKFFALKTMEHHLDLSFSHIMKHWRKSGSSSGKAAGARCALLRYYPPATGIDGKKEKEYYEQVENLVNPLRCPVKLYEFYLSKCPESVKTRSDIFYLYPERSCVPDSPVWYSTQPLGRETVAKMLQRIKMVQDINKPCTV